MNKGIRPIPMEEIIYRENRTMTYYKLVIKYEKEEQFEILKDFDNPEELKAWCLDHHPNAKKIGYMELS